MKKQHAGATLALVAAFAALAFVLYRWRTSGFAWGEFLATIRNIDGRWLAASAILILAAYLGRALRWQVMLRPLAPQSRLLWVVTSTCIGFTAIVLFGRAGEPVRPYLISRRAGVTFSSQIAAWVLERILDLLMVLVIFGVALTQISQSAVRPGPKVQAFVEAGGTVAGLTGLICLVLLLGLWAFHGNVQRRLLDALAFLPERPRGRIQQFLTAFGEGMQSTRSSSYAFQLIAYTVFEWALVAGSFYCLFRGVPATAHLSPIDSVIVLGFVCLGSILQIPGVGGGMQIVTVLVLTQFYGLPLEAASGVAVLWWVVCFVTIVPIGLALAFHEGINWRSLRHIAPTDSAASPPAVNPTL